MTTTDVKTPPRPNDIEMFTITNMTSMPITIMIPQMDTQALIYEDDTLPDLTHIDGQQTEPNNTYVDISDDEPTFLDDEVVVNTTNNDDIVILHAEPSPILKFLPLNSASREECGLLVHIHKCGIIPYTNIGHDLIGEPNNVYKVVGGGNCYFRHILYALSGRKDYHKSI